MYNENDSFGLIGWAMVAILILMITVVLATRDCAGTSIDFAFVDNSCYSKVMNTSKWWDKSIEYARQDLTIWNEIWISPCGYITVIPTKNCGIVIPEGLSVDTNYKVNLANGSYRETLTGNYTSAINKFWTVEGGLGAYWKSDRIYGAFVASNRVRFNFLVFDFSNFTYLYVPVGERIEMQNTLKVKLNVIIAYFSLNFRQEFYENQFSNMNYGSVEIQF